MLPHGSMRLNCSDLYLLTRLLSKYHGSVDLGVQLNRHQLKVTFDNRRSVLMAFNDILASN